MPGRGNVEFHLLMTYSMNITESWRGCARNQFNNDFSKVGSQSLLFVEDCEREGGTGTWGFLFLLRLLRCLGMQRDCRPRGVTQAKRGREICFTPTCPDLETSSGVSTERRTVGSLPGVQLPLTAYSGQCRTVQPRTPLLNHIVIGSQPLCIWSVTYLHPDTRMCH